MKRYNHSMTLLAMALGGSLAVAGCTVEQTEEGSLPDVDVRAEGGNLPEYDVDAADVTVGTRETTITVPKADFYTEEEQVSVPTIDIDVPEDEEDDERR